MTHHYSIVRAVGYFCGGATLLAGSVGLLLVGVPSLWGMLGMVMGGAAIWLGVRGIGDRRKYPMVLADDFISFYARNREIRVAVKDLAAVFYNTKGFDKRASLRKTDGEVVDIPVLYGLNDLVKKLQLRYRLPSV